MKAVIYNSYGGPDVLELVDVPRPEPKAGEVLIRVQAVGLNPRDPNIRRGDLKLISGKKFPKQTGADFTGIVEAVGSGVTSYAPGNAVFGYLENVNAGAAAEFVVAPVGAIALRPPQLDPIQAAAIPCAYSTAWAALHQKARLQAGNEVLIYGASGGVGTAAIQLAKYVGATVTAVCSQASADFCRRNGADRVLSYDKDDVFGNGKTYDLFFQVFSANGLLYDQAKPLIAGKGLFLTLIPNPLYIFRKLFGRPRFDYLLVKANADDLSMLADLAVRGLIQPQVERVFALKDIREAHRVMEQGHVNGKLVVSVP